MILEVEQFIQADNKEEAIKKAKQCIENNTYDLRKYHLDERFSVRKLRNDEKGEIVKIGYVEPEDEESNL